MKPYSKPQIAFKYLRYLLQSKSRYRIHSPFVYDLIENGYRDPRWFYALEDLKEYQEVLQRTKAKMPWQEMGAGQTNSYKQTIRVREFYQRTRRPFKYYRLMFHLARYFRPRTILELGTGLGLSALPLAGGSRLGTLHTIEGNEALSHVVKQMMQERSYNNITFHTGEFSVQLPKVLKQVDQIDLVFLDGNHRYEATLDYFNQIQPKLHEQSLLIMDDIHWSPGMEKAWRELLAKPEVTLSIDFFFLGLLFFEPGREKEHFTLRY